MNYYHFLGISETATPAEIDQAINNKFNEVRRLVTHHDPYIVNKANQDLLVIENARATLMDPRKKSEYDVALGVGGATGGLADPQAILPKFNMGIGSAVPPNIPLGGSQRVTAAPAVPANSWVCVRCQTPHPIGTRFCKQCGNEISTPCPNCNTLLETTASFCQHCGVNVREQQARAEEEAHFREMEIAEQQRREADRLAVIGPISTLSNEAWNLTKWGCITAVIFPIVSLPLWLLGLRKSRKALSYSQVPGDSEYRQLARKAFTWAAIPAGIVIIGGGLYILAALIAVITGNY